MKSIIGVLLIVCMLVSCDDFLEESSQDEVRPSTVSDMEQLMNGESYTTARKEYLQNVTEIFTDDIQCNGPGFFYSETDLVVVRNGRWKFGWQRDMFDENGGGNITDYWEIPYKKIKGCNVVLDYLDKVKGEHDRRENLRGEALTMRAYYYLFLVNFFGMPYNFEDPEKSAGVPLKLHMDVTDEPLRRSSVAEVYRRIEADLLEGNKLLEEYDLPKSLNKANHIMAKAVLSRLYLYMENWDKALEYADLAIQAKPTLLYLSKFNNTTAVVTLEGVYNMETPDEIIWCRSEGGLLNTAIEVSPYSISDDLKSSYEIAEDKTVLDLRYNLYYMNAWNEDFDGKVPDLVCKDRDKANNGIRVAEMYLNRAEAYIRKFIESGKDEFRLSALADLNYLRRHRYTDKVVYKDVDIQDGLKLLDFYKAERRRELCGESNHRWFDLRRYGMPELKHVYFEREGEEQMFVLPAKSSLYVLPIPKQVLEYNSNLEPNL